MMTKAEKKYIKQLQQKKYRNAENAFLVEGWKSIDTFIKGGYTPKIIYATTENKDISANYNVQLITKRELTSTSILKNPKDAMAIFQKKQLDIFQKNTTIIALDNIQDPGNLGTIIRTADWFGVKNIVCSLNTVDCYNPKVVQATMGSLTRVQVNYLDLEQYLKLQKETPIYGAFMDGDNIYTASSIKKECILVLGNEANGISETIEKLISRLH